MRNLAYLRRRAVLVVAASVLGALFLGVTGVQATTPGAAKIIVQKQTAPEGGGPFSFTFTRPNGNSFAFSLSDGDHRTTGQLDVGTYSVAEAGTEGWTLASASCSDGSSPSSISISEGEEVTCVFVNTKNPPPPPPPPPCEDCEPTPQNPPPPPPPGPHLCPDGKPPEPAETAYDPNDDCKRAPPKGQTSPPPPPPPPPPAPVTPPPPPPVAPPPPPAPFVPPTPKPKPNVCLTLTVTPKLVRVDGKPDLVSARVTAGKKNMANVKVLVTAKGVRATDRTNARGVAIIRVNVTDPGVMTISILGRKACGSKRIGVVGIFLPPLAG